MHPDFRTYRNWLFVLCGMVLAFVALVFPVWEGFDETAHFCYVQHLVEHREIPRATDFCSREVEATLEKLPLNVYLAQNTPQIQQYHFSEYQQYWSEKKDVGKEVIPNEVSSRKETTRKLDIWQAQHPPLPYVIGSIPYLLTYGADFYVRFFAMRIWMVLLTIGGLIFMWKAISLALEEESMRLLGFAAIALHPMFFIHFGRISNEPVAFIFVSLIWYFLMKIHTEERPSWKTFVFLGFAYSLGMLSKINIVSLVPALLIVMGMDVLARKHKVQRWQRSKGYVLTLLIGILLGGSWYVYQEIAFGNWSGLAAAQQLPMAFGEILQRIGTVSWLTYFREVFLNFTGLFGWSFIRIDKWYYFAMLLFYVAVFIGLVRLEKKQFRTAAMACMFPLSLLGAMAYFNLRFDFLAITGGWYLYTLSAMLATIVGLALGKLIPEKFRISAALMIALINVASLGYVAIAYLIPRYYAL